MTPRFTQRHWTIAAQHPRVRAQELIVARRVAARARAINDAEGGSATISVESGVRPRGRSYVNVKSNRADEEHGTETTTRRAALRRAANGG
ncbi:hypothetical protein PBI_HUFFY_16 [Gordonia phage Huffy]|uniref:Uncharacterized protein n=3 Tax=Vendettavirus TaxID=2049885 RepID=A0A160DD28_9CAUD|nr:head closure Hc1 [Gordonia phage Vendetta]YP_009275369.1 head closure Hc1 [Gordonia phage Splinter]YP_010051105.1 head closure Hc1 [Gordonia phage TZGordon]AQY55618.1 hypothetical protein PBI_HUFFY_16 [Gordonia phage Huffy]AQY55700.1 hypothetical protein PBI_DINODARYN_16 [Gordonia phage DinoDaryn]WNO25759.1 hypothetical protein SEA_GOIB_15 [Gordonia phage Goib]ANA85562.1 hypothetical protein PBI_VENDETTA_14 [Gordonia phage Vendetta]ANA85641.1 hypothetical protein PBI_SPLINTER_14 [Gordonia